MVIDASALVALRLGEPETADFVAAIAAAPHRALSASSYLETAIVMTGRLGAPAVQPLNRLLQELSIDVVPFTREQATLALAAYCRFGKGRGHLAGLNFGDCFSCAPAKLSDEPLSFEGRDFVHTDVAPAMPTPA